MVVMNTVNKISLKTVIENWQKTYDHNNHVWSYLFNGLREVIFVGYFSYLKKKEMLTQTYVVEFKIYLNFYGCCLFVVWVIEFGL